MKERSGKLSAVVLVFAFYINSRILLGSKLAKS